MMRRLGRVFVLLLTLGILYSGPVAACVCADETAPAMPCCPDEPQDTGHSNLGLPHSLDAACDPAPADVLPAGSQDLSAPIAIPSATPPAWLSHGPPAAPALAFQQPFDTPPIYLVTLRLRN